MTVSIITFMSVERWLHMTRRSLITARRACYFIAVLLVLSIPVAVLRIKGADHQRLLLDAFTISLVLFSLSVTPLVYYKVFRIIRCHQQQVSQSNESSHNFGQPSINLAKYKKSVFSIIYILAVFYLGYGPMVITLGVFIGLPRTYLNVRMSALKVTMVFMFLSSSLHPLLYLWRMKDIRDEVKKLVKRMLRKDN